MMDTSNDDPCVSSNLFKTARMVNRIYAQEMQQYGLTRSQFSILAHLSKSKMIAISDLAEELCMDRTTLSRNLKPLVKLALIDIKATPSDKRYKQVVLTGKGKAALKQALVGWNKAQNKIIRAFGANSWLSLKQDLVRLRNIPQ